MKEKLNNSLLPYLPYLPYPRQFSVSKGSAIAFFLPYLPYPRQVCVSGRFPRGKKASFRGILFLNPLPDLEMAKVVNNKANIKTPKTLTRSGNGKSGKKGNNKKSNN